jgi:hypothetical protein
MLREGLIRSRTHLYSFYIIQKRKEKEEEKGVVKFNATAWILIFWASFTATCLQKDK